VKAYSNLIGLWYNADILDKVSIAPPTTFDPGLGTKVSAVRQVFGQGWNGVLAGQKTPQRSAQDVVDGLNRLLHP
jgi:ABC-type glycerol-3-phosphate transport system substrate-binding protein